MSDTMTIALSAETLGDLLKALRSKQEDQIARVTAFLSQIAGIRIPVNSINQPVCVDFPDNSGVLPKTRNVTVLRTSRATGTLALIRGERFEILEGINDPTLSDRETRFQLLRKVVLHDKKAREVHTSERDYPAEKGIQQLQESVDQLPDKLRVVLCEVLESLKESDLSEVLKRVSKDSLCSTEG